MRTKLVTETITYKSTELQVTFEYYSGWKSNDYLSPNDDAEIEITEITVGGVDVFGLIDSIKNGLEEIEEILFNTIGQ